MKSKILLLVGIGVGYVLGARAGRERYNEIKRFASKLWNDPRVQQGVDNAGDFVKDKAPDVAAFVADTTKKVVRQVSGSSAPAKKPAAKSTAASKTTTK